MEWQAQFTGTKQKVGVLKNQYEVAYEPKKLERV